ncbi:MAG: NADH-quinone oxidoreductase subunit N [Nitrospinota bacterium]
MEITAPPIDLTGIMPMIIIAITGILVLIIDLFLKERSKNILIFISLTGVIIAARVSFSQYGGIHYSFHRTFVMDTFSVFFNLIFLLGTALTILISANYIKREEINHGEYYALILFATMGMMLMAGGSDLIIIFLGLEVMSISLYILAGFRRTKKESNEAALKYFLLGAFATGFLLYGIAILYGVAGSTNLKDIAASIPGRLFVQKPLLLMGMALLIIGLGFKVASVPFHMWTPDVYEGAPTSITAFMSAGPKAAAFAVFFRIFIDSLGNMEPNWNIIIGIMAVLTMTVGNVLAIAQDNIKRMLAYSSIAHAGYILVALVAANSLGFTSVLFYMLAYTLMNMGAFAIIIILGNKGEEHLNISDYAGLGFKRPLIAFAMSVFMFSMAGIPPMAGFIGKFYIFSAAIKAGYIGLAIIGVINSVISVFYYLRITVIMYMREPVREFNPISLSPLIILALIISVWGTLHLGILPGTIIEFARKSTFAFF